MATLPKTVTVHVTLPGKSFYLCGAATYVNDPTGIRPDGQHALKWPVGVDVVVSVVASPAAYDPNFGTGVPTQISLATLAELEKDPRIATSITAGGGAEDPARLNAIIADLTARLDKLRFLGVQSMVNEQKAYLNAAIATANASLAVVNNTIFLGL